MERHNASPKEPLPQANCKLVLVMWARKDASNVSRLLDSNTYVIINMISEETIEMC